MKKSDDTKIQGKDNELINDNVQSLIKLINKLSNELETVRGNVQKRKSENTSLKVLFYTGLIVLFMGFIYSNSKLQRAHIKSLEKNIISLEQRMAKDINQIKMNLELDILGIQNKLDPVNNDIFNILGRMDYAISQIDPKEERIAMLINQVRLDSDDFSRILKGQKSLTKTK